ncbi:hypothetical protein AB0L17_33890, partial [Streptomyces cellulosae]
PRAAAAHPAVPAGRFPRETRDRFPRLTDVKARLAAMDASGIDVRLVSPSPPPACIAHRRPARQATPPVPHALTSRQAR